ncbi:MAG: hypothetical protein WKF43_01020 [Acidimicrobiales bacterium]
MTAVGFLLLAVAISAVGCAVVYFRSRQPTSLESGIDAFRREMQALSPDEADKPTRTRADPPEGT